MSAAIPDESRLGGLIAAADRASAAGRRSDAERLLSQARSIAPAHPYVLNALGLFALNGGDFGAARRHLEAAVAGEPGAPLYRFHLALVCRAQGDRAGEINALDACLALDGHFYMALLQKATFLERDGLSKQAAKLYSAFLTCLPQDLREAPAMQRAIQRARSAVAANAAAFEEYLRTRLAPVREHHADAPQERFDRCLDVLVGKRRVFVPQPTFMHFPQLPALEFHPRRDFPWLDRFERATDRIRDELVSLIETDAEGLVPYVNYADSEPLDQWKELNRSRRWSAYYLIQNGKALHEHLSRCPVTAELLAGAPLADVPGEAPTAFFSLLEPHTHIPPHTGVTNTRLVVHLPLIVPPGCRFRVGAETREWKPGEAWIFDDTIEHEAWNDSSEPRVILLIDTWNPYLTDSERDLVRAATQAASAYYRE